MEKVQPVNIMDILNDHGLQQQIIDGVIKLVDHQILHNDLHAGNVATTIGKEKKIVFIDFGEASTPDQKVQNIYKSGIVAFQLTKLVDVFNRNNCFSKDSWPACMFSDRIFDKLNTEPLCPLMQYIDQALKPK